MPLHPEKKSTITEIPIRGIIGISINGVPAYGPQEGGSSNAVEPGTDSFITDAQVLIITFPPELQTPTSSHSSTLVT